MTVQVIVQDDAVDIRFTGLDRVLCLAKGLTLAMSEITGVRVVPQREAKADVGWRVGGGYWPGAFATGWFTWKGRKGVRQLWCAYRDEVVLVIDTTRAVPARVVLQHPDRDDIAWFIGERRATRA
ncbi:MAG TPA: hypothetical protein VF855_14315 [Acidimicrobiales bacterium]